MNMPNLTEMRNFFNNIASDYDKLIVDKSDADMESKQLVANFLPKHTETLIDFGIGTGLELDSIFKKFPGITVTGLDYSENMLQILKVKYSNRNIRLHCESYLDYDFGHEQYDAALSIKTLHHYDHDVKTSLYRRIHACLNANGVYIECDKIAATQTEEDFHFAEYKCLKQSQGLPDEYECHYDTPCTLENQTKMLFDAGFCNVREVWRSEYKPLLASHIATGAIVILIADK